LCLLGGESRTGTGHTRGSASTMVSEGRLLWERLDVDNRADATTMRRRRRWQSAAAVRDPL